MPTNPILPYPVQPVVNQIFVNNSPAPEWFLDMEVMQTWGEHEMVQLRVEFQRSDNMATYIPWPNNAPVEIVWGRKPAQYQTWYGYVNHHRMGNSDTGNKNLQITYHLVGVSKPMNTDVSKNWGSVTPTYIAKTLATKYNLRCVVTSTDWVIGSIIQANESDFQFLNRMANKTGYRFWVGNGTLYFIDPQVYLSSMGTQGVPSFTYNKALQAQDTMRDFQMIKGDNLPGAVQAQRSLYGVDASSGRTFQVFSDNPTSSQVQQINTKRVATSFAEGQQVVKSWQTLSQFWIGASAELFGNSDIYPGKLIYLEGAALPDSNDGYWMITSARHVLKQSSTSKATADKYMVQVEMVKNQSSPYPKVKGVATLRPEYCNCVFDRAKKQWKSTNTSVIYDGITQ